MNFKLYLNLREDTEQKLMANGNVPTVGIVYKDGVNRTDRTGTRAGN